jgi:hypothetical protein
VQPLPGIITQRSAEPLMSMAAMMRSADARIDWRMPLQSEFVQSRDARSVIV